MLAAQNGSRLIKWPMIGIGTHQIQLEHEVSTKGIMENQGHLSRKGRTTVQSMGVRGKDQTVRLETKGDIIKTKADLELTGGPNLGVLSERLKYQWLSANCYVAHL